MGKRPNPPKNLFTALMIERGFTIHALSVVLDCSPATLNQWRYGIAKPRKPEYVARIEAFFGRTIDELFAPYDPAERAIQTPKRDPASIAALRKQKDVVPYVPPKRNEAAELIALPWVVYPRDPVTCDAIAMMLDAAIRSARLGPEELRYFETSRDHLRALAQRLRRPKVEGEAHVHTSHRPVSERLASLG